MLRLIVPIAALSAGLHETPSAIERIEANSNRVPAGRMSAGVLRVDLEVRLGRWVPTGDTTASPVLQAFAEVGHRLQVPGPLVRARAGTRVSVSIRNRLTESMLVVHGFQSAEGWPDDTIQIAPGATRRVEFTAAAPGTYFYWASTTGNPLDTRDGIDSQLSGAIVIDSASARGLPRDRVFVLGVWHAPVDSSGHKPWVERDQMVINGRSWPHTERFSYSTGDTVRWRWVNPSSDAHPMHLHGFYYRVDSRGTWSGDTIYAPDQRRMVVTEMLLPGETMSTTWVPTTPGNWLMHCHFTFHTSHYLSFAKVPEPVDAASADEVVHAVHSMAGLILGIRVRERDQVAAPAPTFAAGMPRSIRLLIQSARARYDTSLGYGYIPQDTPATIPSDSVPVLSPPLVLHRGERTRINVVNQLRAPSSVHWHGIELSDSYYDGVPNWSGVPGRLAPLIAPHDSFSVELTPPRAGTFIYHSHSNETHQISSGLYGALIVLDSGQRFDAVHDRVFIVGGNGPDDKHGRVNGELEPAEQTLVAGTTYRFRVVQINPDWRVYASLKADSVVQRWQAIAKDGADLPAHQATLRAARILMGPGETADFKFVPREPGRMILEVATQLAGWRLAVPLRIVGRDQ